MALHTSKLDNGITIATENNPVAESVTLGVWFKTGARAERSHEHGVAHLLEHMAFKGTGRRSAAQIAAEIEDVGGEINAATSVETTAYYARVLKEDIDLAIDLLSDILCDSRFDETEMEREKHVILQELGAAEDTPDDVVFDRFSETAYAGQPIGRSILGTRESIAGFTAADLRAFMAREYCPDRMTIVAVGPVEHEQMVRSIERAFSCLKPQEGVHRELSAVYTGGDYREERDLLDAQLLLGFEGRPYHADEFYACQLLSMILGGGMSSRLFQEARERRGLCYSIYAFHWAYSDSGLFGIHAATERDDVEELSMLVGEELAKIQDSVSTAELNRSRAQYRAGLLMARESTIGRASQIAKQLLLFGRPIPDDELLGRLAAIDEKRITDLAGKLFGDGQSTLAAIGPVGSLPEASLILGRPASPKVATLRHA